MLNSPVAFANIKGGSLAPSLKGTARFYRYKKGTLVEIQVEGLPEFAPATSKSPQIGPFGLHIHEQGHCGDGGGKEPFSLAGGHYNPDGQPHGNHAGDLPVLFPNDGTARMSVYTSRFTPEEVIGRSIMIHHSPDDFKSQPAGGSGTRIACGEIIRARPLMR